jgi:hypothetical protein
MKEVFDKRYYNCDHKILRPDFRQQTIDIKEFQGSKVFKKIPVKSSLSRDSLQHTTRKL